MAKKPAKHVVHKKTEDDLSISIPSKFRLTKLHWGIAAIIVALLLIIAITAYVTSKKDPVIATINDEAIYKSDVAVVRAFYPDTGSISDEQVVKDILVPQTLLSQEAEKRGIEVTEQDAESFISNSLSQTGATKESFEQELKKAGVTYAQFVKYIGANLQIQALQQEILADTKVTISDSEVRAFYEENRNKIPANVTFEEARPSLAEFLLKQKQDQHILEFVEQLKAQAKIVYR